MTDFRDKTGLQKVEALQFAGATYAQGMHSNSVPGLLFANLSFTNFSVSHSAVIDCGNTDATVATQYVAQLAQLLHDTGVIKIGK